MAKIFNFVIIVSGMLILLALAGMPTASNFLLSKFGLTTGIGSFSLTTTILAALAIATVAGVFALSATTGGNITIGTFAINVTESKIIAGFCGLLMSWVILDLFSVINVANDTGQPWIQTLTMLIIIPTIIAFVIGMIQFWRGNDI